MPDSNHTKNKKLRVYSFLFLLLFLLYPEAYLPGVSHNAVSGQDQNRLEEESPSFTETEDENDRNTQTDEEDDTEQKMMEQLARRENIRQQYPLLEQLPENADPADYILLLAPNDRSYQVKAGDTLWGISRQHYLTGTAWSVLAAQYPGLAEDSTALLPGTQLSLPDLYYIRRQQQSQGGFSSPALTYDMPADWHFGYTEWEACLDSYWSQCQDAHIYAHVTESATAAFSFPAYSQEQMSDLTAAIRNCMEQTVSQTPGIRFTQLSFAQYLRQDGTNLFFYTFLADTDEAQYQCAVAYTNGDTYTAEFIGFSPMPDNPADSGLVCPIDQITRYLAASYTELGGEKNWSSLKYRPYLGADTWNWDGLHNPFAMAATLYAPEEDAVLNVADYELNFVSEEWEDLLRRMVRYHYNMTAEEKKAFYERPLMASDVAWITEITLTEHPVPGRDTVRINSLRPGTEYDLADFNLTTARDLAILPNLRKLELETGTISDYEALAGCPSLEELSIVSARPMQDASWFSELPHLKSLTLEISMFTHLHTLGFTDDEPTTFLTEDAPDTDYYEQVSYDPAFFDSLAQCRRLEYLSIRHTGTFDSAFLEKMPNLYCFRLSGEDSETEIGQKRLQDYEDAPSHYSRLQCLAIDDVWLKNPE